MRAWLLQGRQGEDPGGLRTILRQWAERPANAAWHVDVHPLGSDLPARVQAHRPEVLIFAASLAPLRSWIEEILSLEVSLIVAAEESQVEAYHDLAERHVLLFVPPQPGGEVLGLALQGARAALRREQYWKTQVEQLHQRLNDRIVIERAKGVLVQRLGIGEEEAYKRLRVLSRRQRRQIRDIAQSLLDTQALLLPPGNGYGGHELLAPEEGRPTEPPSGKTEAP
jgi:two-component system, response regulator / RNA-binding antiterminator